MNPENLLTVTDDEGNKYIVDRLKLDPIKMTVVGELPIQAVSSGGHVVIIMDEQGSESMEFSELVRGYDGLAVNDINSGDMCSSVLFAIDEAEDLRNELNNAIREAKGL